MKKSNNQYKQKAMSITKNKQKPAKQINEKISVEKAQQVLREESKKKMDECAKGIEAELKKHGFALVSEGQFSGNKIETRIILVPAK